MRNGTPSGASGHVSDPDKREGEVLRLDKQRLLAALHRLRAAGSMVELRTAVQSLRRRVLDRRGAIRTGRNGDWVNFPRELLVDELDQIAESQTVERALYYVDRLARSATEVRVSSVNDINLNRWKEYVDIQTDSLWVVDQRDGSGVHSARYWGNFIPQIPNQMMRRYTKPGEWVLDVFAGSGTTLIEGQRLGRNTIGIELQASVARQARRAVRSERNERGVTTKIVTRSCLSADYGKILASVGQQSVQLAILHPPYYDIIKFSDDTRDLSNAPSVDSFVESMGRVADNVASVLDAGRYLVLVIGDKYSNGEWIPLGFLTMNEVLKRNFTLKSIIVKNFEETTGKRQQKELWKYRALAGGFYVFKHEYIFVFRKRHELSAL